MLPNLSNLADTGLGLLDSWEDKLAEANDQVLIGHFQDILSRVGDPSALLGVRRASKPKAVQLYTIQSWGESKEYMLFFEYMFYKKEDDLLVFEYRVMINGVRFTKRWESVLMGPISSPSPDADLLPSFSAQFYKKRLAEIQPGL